MAVLAEAYTPLVCGTRVVTSSAQRGLSLGLWILFAVLLMKLLDHLFERLLHCLFHHLYHLLGRAIEEKTVTGATGNEEREAPGGHVLTSWLSLLLQLLPAHLHVLVIGLLDGVER